MGMQLSGSLNLTGSLNLSGSTTQIGTNTLLGNTTLSGSIIISGSQNPSTPSVKIFGDFQTDGVLKFSPISRTIDSSLSASYVYVSGSTNDLYFSQNGQGYSNTTRLRWIEGNLFTGLLHGGIISATNGGTTFNISSGSGIIVTLNSTINSDPYPTINYVNWNNITNIPITYLTTAIQSFIAIDVTGGVYQQASAFTDGDYNNYITLGSVLHQNKSTVNATITYPNVAYGYKQRTYDFIRAFGPLKLGGLNILPSGSTGLQVSSGTAFADGRNYQINPNSPSYITDSGTTVSKIFRYYQSGSEFIQDTNNALGYTALDPTQYNVNGTLTTVSGNNPNNYYWTIKRVFWYPNSATKGIVVYYGNAQYSSKVEAQAAVSTETFSEVENTKQNAVFLGAILVRKDLDFTNPLTYQIVQGGLFRSVTGGGGAGGSGATSVSQLSDIQFTTLESGDLLKYDAQNSRWTNSKILTGSYQITGSLTISGSLKVRDGVTGSFLGNLNGTATNATNLVVQNSSANGKYAVLFTTAGVNGNLVGYTDPAGGILYNPSTNKMELTGSMAVTGSLTINSGSITMPNRPAFRVVGVASTDRTAPLTLSGSIVSVDYNEGNYYDNTNGLFTAPLAGLYNVFFNGRVGSANSQMQVIIQKNNTIPQFMWEAPGLAASTHFGVSGIVKLAANDTLRATVTVGTVQFDGNDSWGAAYIG